MAAIKKVVAKKAVVKKTTTKKETTVTCSNCNDSGMTCYACGYGRLQE